MNAGATGSTQGPQDGLLGLLGSGTSSFKGQQSSQGPGLIWRRRGDFIKIFSYKAAMKQESSAMKPLCEGSSGEGFLKTLKCGGRGDSLDELFSGRIECLSPTWRKQTPSSVIGGPANLLLES